MRPARIGIAALALSAASAAGCNPAGGRDALTPGSEFGALPTCKAFNPLVDLRYAMKATADFGASSELLPLVDIDEELGYVHLAQSRLKGLSGPQAHTLVEELARLAALLDEQRSKIAAAVSQLEATYEAAEVALDSAALCNGVDLRAPSLPARAAKKLWDWKGTDDGLDEAKREAVRKANLVTLASPACEAVVRLWSSARGADLGSDISSSSVAAHIAELTLDKERSEIRSRLATALKQHAEALRRLHTTASPKTQERDAAFTQLVAQRATVTKDVDAARLGCLATMHASERIVGRDPNPRRVTVTVRPKWGSLNSLAGAGAIEFGSGFVVRWRGANGQLETRVVTNNHVMDGALEAEIISGDPELAGPEQDAARANGKDKGWSAVLIQANPHDDVAILRLDPKIVNAPPGVSFRLEPATEQEQVVAAGFPGVGVRPSFQVSRGTVSNARFGADADADSSDAYVQHTAAIDPGNSGGPLLDGEGRLVGMNTLKIVGRENVGLAVPTSRIQQALMRAEEIVAVDIKNAEASCNAVMAALASPQPVNEAMSRFSLALFESSKDEESRKASIYRDRVQGQPGNPVEEARLRAYGAIRASLEEEGGVRPFEVCRDLHSTHSATAPNERFVATMRTRSAEHELVFAEENGVVRLTQMR